MARPRGDADSAARMIEGLARADQPIVTREAEAEIRRALPRLWDAGWQPAEIVRHAGGPPPGAAG